MNATTFTGDNIWRTISVALIAACVTGISFNLYYAQTTVSRSDAVALITRERLEADLEIADLQEEIGLIRDRQDDVRLRLAALSTQVEIIRVQLDQQTEGGTQ